MGVEGIGEPIDAEFEEIVEQINTKFVNDSLAECIDNISGIPAGIFEDIQTIIDRIGVSEWYKPYVEILKHHGYDMIFYEYKPAEPIGGDKTLENIEFNSLPTGKCLIMGVDPKNIFKCMVGLMNEAHEVTVIYDPVPDTVLFKLSHVGFFIKTFVDPE